MNQYPPAFALFAGLMMAGIAMISAGCQPTGSSTSSRASQQERADRLVAESQLEIVRTYRQAFETEAALSDFESAPVTLTAGTTTASIEGGRLILAGAVAEWTPEGVESPIATNPRGILWLDKPLPHLVEIEFEIEALDKPMDFNCIIAGNGESASGYEIVIGGHDNTKNGIYLYLPAELDGAGFSREKIGGSREMLPLYKGTAYTVKIERDGAYLRTYLNDTLIMEIEDEFSYQTPDGTEVVVAPVVDDSLRYFAFSTWNNRVAIDNLSIREIEPNIRLGLTPPSRP